MIKCFTYTLNSNFQGPDVKLPIGSLTGLFANDVYYGAAIIDNLDMLSDWNAVEITPLEFNQTFTPPPSTEIPNPSPYLAAMELEVRKCYAQKLSLISLPYSLEERETWHLQIKEAENYIANNQSSTPLLSAIANARNISVLELSNIIISKDEIYRQAIGNILGEQQVLIEKLWKIN